MSKNTLLNYFTRSPVISKKENGDSSLNKENDGDGLSKTPKRKKSESSPLQNRSECGPPSAAVTTDRKDSSKVHNSSNKTPSSSKKRAKKVSLENFNSPSTRKSPVEAGRKSDEDNDDACDDYESPPSKKRKRIIMELESEEENSEDEYMPDKEAESSEESESDVASSEEEEPSVNSDSEEPTPKKTTKKKTGPVKSLNNSTVSEKPKLSLSSTVKENSADNDSWPHLKLLFLQPDKIRDGNRRLKTDPNYDPKTLYVPEDFKNKLTPAVRQWWEMKSQNFDIVLFFKVGKFYELYHMDAVIAANELNLTFMRGEFAHVGFPEIAYGRFSATLIEKGYKVARVEQTETPDMMNERCKQMSKCTKFDKVVRREICQITSRGTRVFGILDGETKEAESNFLLAIAEKEINSTCSHYGVCFIDTSIGLFHIGQFEDDRHASRLRTLVAHYTPVQILTEKGQVTAKTRSLFNTVLSSASKDSLVPDKEFWSSSKTLITLAENYYPDKNFPAPLLKFLGEESLINLTSKDENELGIRALGALVWCLQRSLIDYQLLTMGRFTIYEPIDSKKPVLLPPKDDTVDGFTDKRMVLDAITLKNLNILESANGSVQGTLLHKLDNCCTPFGKRLLLRWICSPLGNIKSIIARQEAVQFLLKSDMIQDIRSILSQLPDLERLFSRIHSQGSNGISESHPDTRAFLFEEKKYSKRKIIDFITTLNGFKVATKIIDLFEKIPDEVVPNLIRQCCTLASKSEKGSFPDLSHHLQFFERAFDHQEAQKEGRILPSPGTDSDYDNAMEALRDIEKDLNKYLKEQCTHFGCKVTYHGNDKKRYQLEVPESAVRRANSNYELVGQRKGFKRYVTEETKSFLEQMISAEEQKINVLKNLRERIFSKFSKKFCDWNAAIQCLSVLDVLSAFAEYSRNEDITCLPKFVPVSTSQSPFVFLNDGRYPCSTGDDVFIPNSTVVGSSGDESHPQLVLVTGPNMGGKSTLMRQLGLIVIMAHMGCYVPAVDLKLSLVDRIFTRLGANDDIMAGESTFYVELCETSSILQHATKHSLVLIDELGRGTSTYDGTAIASAVLKELSRIQCRTLFSTHYHSLVEDFRHDTNIALGHMACMVENENEDEENDSEETVTFLYKFAEGACPKSYGFNAARLAGMPRHITKIGHQRAKQLEVDVCKRNNFKKLFRLDVNSMCELISQL